MHVFFPTRLRTPYPALRSPPTRGGGEGEEGGGDGGEAQARGGERLEAKKAERERAAVAAEVAGDVEMNKEES